MGAPRIYFPHPQNTYGTELEIECVQTIYDFFKGQISLVNPSDNVHQGKVAEIKALNAGKEKDAVSKLVMEYFIDLVGECHGAVGLIFRDGMLGAGVFAEQERIAQNGHPIWLINQYMNIVPTTLERIRPLELSVNATRARIRISDGSRRPY